MDLRLPPLPRRMAKLPRDYRGFPVPWFVAWLDGGEYAPIGQGEPDFRVVGPDKIGRAWRSKLCWVCGEPLGTHKVHVIGPMCVINRVTSEPPCHRDCAEFSAKACPFLTRPRQKRDRKNLPADGVTAGFPIDRNPGATALYETRHAAPFQAGEGVLFRLGAPDRVDWYAQGRIATRAEIEASIESGYPILRKMAEDEGADAVAELEKMRATAMQYLPAA